MQEVAMTKWKRRSARSGREALRSPGRPPVGRREHRRVFWSAIAAGRSSEDDEKHPDLLFPGRHKGKSLDPSGWLLRDLKKKGAPADFTYHQVRYTLATWLQNRGHDEYDRGLVLNHAGAGTVTDRYSRRYPLERKRLLLEAWAEHVETLVSRPGVALLR
jgi:integrase